MTYFPSRGTVSSGNSSTSTLNSAATFTGTWQDVSGFNSVVVAVNTDQNGSFTVQFSPDGTNIDSTLTRYYRTTQIEAPHRFTITRKYMRVTFTNDSASNQTLFRLQTLLGNKEDLNTPLDSTMAQDFDSTSVRPSDFHYEVALGRRQGHETWNKFGYNEDVDIGTGPETIWSPGGMFSQLTTARTLSIVSTSADDDSGGNGANSVRIWGIDANWDEQIVDVVLDGTTPVVTTETWLGVNRISITLAGSGLTNAGIITATATTDLTVQAQIEIGVSVTQHMFFFIPDSYIALLDWLVINVARFGSGTEPVITVKSFVTSDISNAKYEVYRTLVDTSISGHLELNPSQPFVVGERSLIEFTAETTRDNTSVQGRFSLILVRDADA